MRYLGKILNGISLKRVFIFRLEVHGFKGKIDCELGNLVFSRNLKLCFMMSSIVGVNNKEAQGLQGI